jgi:hypothetical protein
MHLMGPSMSNFASKLRTSGIVFIMAIIIPMIINIGTTIISPRPTIHYTDASYKLKRHAYKTPQERQALEQEAASFKTRKATYTAALKQHKKIVFFSHVLLGLACVVLGLVLNLGFLNAGLIWGGGFSLAFATIDYWGSLNAIGQFCTLIIILGLVMRIAYVRLIKPSQQPAND